MEIKLLQILFQIVNFSVVLGALTYLLYKPVLKVLDERQKRIVEGQRAAEAAIKDKEKLTELEKEVKQAAEKQASEILEKARESAKRTEAELLASARKKAEEEVEKLTSSWKDEKKQHLEDMRREFVSAVVATAEKVVGTLDAKAHQKLIDAELEKLLKSI